VRFIATVYENIDSNFLSGYKDRDRLTHYATEQDVDVASELVACEAMFWKYNQDDRPNGKTHRSLSCGDVIRLQNKETEQVSHWSCETFGFKWIEPPMAERILDNASARKAQGR
jgi:hypothetical protein